MTRQINSLQPELFLGHFMFFLSSIRCEVYRSIAIDTSKAKFSIQFASIEVRYWERIHLSNWRKTLHLSLFRFLVRFSSNKVRFNRIHFDEDTGKCGKALCIIFTSIKLFDEWSKTHQQSTKSQQKIGEEEDEWKHIVSFRKSIPFVSSSDTGWMEDETWFTKTRFT